MSSGELRRAEVSLRQIDQTWPNWASLSSSILQELNKLKAAAVAAADEVQANRIWCLEEVCVLYKHYLEAFAAFKENRFYDAWCKLEQAELSALRLERHLEDRFDTFKVRYIARIVEQYQQLFPYTIFMSPEIVHEEKICSICAQKISINRSCGHRPGNLYTGEYCYRKITISKFVAMAFVQRPAHKYSVPFVTNQTTGTPKQDNYDYSQVRYVVDRLESPFHDWTMQWTHRRNPHHLFADCGRNDACPCGSGKKYKRCCWLQDGVLQRHVDVEFDVPPPEESLKIQYPSSNRRPRPQKPGGRREG